MVKRSLSSSSEKSMRDHFAWGIPGELAKLPTAAIESIKTLYYVPLAICYRHQVYICFDVFLFFFPVCHCFPLMFYLISLHHINLSLLRFSISPRLSEMTVIWKWEQPRSSQSLRGPQKKELSMKAVSGQTTRWSSMCQSHLVCRVISSWFPMASGW